jgi:hypothetical protein
LVILSFHLRIVLPGAPAPEEPRGHLARSFSPLAPMRRINLDAPFGQSINPAIRLALARKQQCMCAGSVNDSHFNIAIERCAGYRLPLHG